MLKNKKRNQLIKSVYKNPKTKPNKTITTNKKRSCQKYTSTKQNDEHQMNRELRSPIRHNKDLLSNCMKPNKMNYMNKISKIYDLVLAHVSLPQFVEYFLGEAVYSLNDSLKSSKKSKLNEDNKAIQILNTKMSWKLDNFKKACLKIYEQSDEEDLKIFMKIDLPALNRWRSNSVKLQAKEAFIKTNYTLASNLNKTFNKTQTSFPGSLKNDMSVSQGSRINYFKNLVKKDVVGLQKVEDSPECQAIDRMTNKINAYLMTYGKKIPSAAIID